MSNTWRCAKSNLFRSGHWLFHSWRGVYTLPLNWFNITTIINTTHIYYLIVVLYIIISVISKTINLSPFNKNKSIIVDDRYFFKWIYGFKLGCELFSYNMQYIILWYVSNNYNIIMSSIFTHLSVNPQPFLRMELRLF